MAKLVTVRTNINGQDFTLEVEPRLLLVDLIRDKTHLKGTHVACDTGNCGACTVLMNDVTVKSCQVLSPRVDGAAIVTIEGLASKNGNLHPVQEAFWDADALECGYCTPGMIMTTLALLKKQASPSEEEIRKEFSGNFCRCTGYLNIIKAVKLAAESISRKE